MGTRHDLPSTTFCSCLVRFFGVSSLLRRCPRPTPTGKSASRSTRRQLRVAHMQLERKCLRRQFVALKEVDLGQARLSRPIPFCFCEACERVSVHKEGIATVKFFASLLSSFLIFFSRRNEVMSTDVSPQKNACAEESSPAALRRIRRVRSFLGDPLIVLARAGEKRRSYLKSFLLVNDLCVRSPRPCVFAGPWRGLLPLRGAIDALAFFSFLSWAVALAAVWAVTADFCTTSGLHA